jgi:hypothetical protein
MDTIDTLKNCMTVCPGPWEQYNSEHTHVHAYGYEPYKEGMYHIYSILYTLATT